MPEAEFWQLTPRLIQGLSERHAGEVKREDYRAGILAVILANAHRGTKRQHRPYSLADFFTSLADMKPREQTDEDMLEVMKMAAVMTR